VVQVPLLQVGTVVLALRNAVCGVIAAVAAAGCNSPDSREVKRATSPDGVVDIVVTSKDDVSATVATPTELYIVKRGEAWNEHSPILKGDNLEGLEANWQSPRQLEIGIQQGRVFSFTNFWVAPGSIKVRAPEKGPDGLSRAGLESDTR
jgi:hypothetical protein